MKLTLKNKFEKGQQIVTAYDEQGECLLTLDLSAGGQDCKAMTLAGLRTGIPSEIFEYANHLLDDRFTSFEYLNITNDGVDTYAAARASMEMSKPKTNTQHTPAPWTVKPSGGKGYTIQEWKGSAIEDLANAQLIASAPDLLKENEQLKERLEANATKFVEVYMPKIEKLEALNAELLEALKAARPILIETVEKWSNGEDSYQSALDMTDSAIVKAEGKVN